MPETIARVPFSRFKYRREVCVDARPLEAWTGIERGDRRPHRLDFHELLLVERGRATFFTDAQRVAVHGPSIVITAAIQVRRVEVEQPLEGRLVVLTNDAWARAAAGAGGDRWPTPGALAAVQPDAMARVSDVARTMSREIEEAHADMPAMLEALLAQLLMLLRRMPGPAAGANRREPAVLARFRRMLEERFQVEHRAAVYAGELGVSLDHLSEVARMQTGLSVKGLIQQRVHQEAARLLLHSDASVAEIAFRLGYAEPGHFARSFRHAVGLSPARFRARIPQKYR